MPTRWMVGGIWAVLLVCDRNTMAAEPIREITNVVKKVTFLGAKHIKEDDLRKIVGINPGMSLNPNLNRQGCRKILAKYAEMGRSFAYCKLLKGGDRTDTEVVYQITEGPKITVRDIRFKGNTFVSGARLATQIKASKGWFHLIGGIYNKQKAETDVDELYKYFRRFGYQDVRIALETQRSADGSEVTMIFHIKEGLRYRVVESLEGVSHNIPRAQLFALSSFKPDDGKKEIPDGATSIQLPSGYQGQEATRIEVADSPTRIGKIRVTANKRISTESIPAIATPR